MRGRAFVGISGYQYKHWRGAFYPHGLALRRWLEFASLHFNSIELNGTFYSLKSPAVFQRWAAEVPEQNFIFAIKGSRYITHNLKLRNYEQALANFLASGVLALGPRLGPFLWQLPASYPFEAARIEAFLASLPATSLEAAVLARHHDHRLKRGAFTEVGRDFRLLHALEVRHPSYACSEFYAILKARGCAFVQADTAGRFLYGEEVTAGFVYARLHGSQELYVSRYSDEELDMWAFRLDGYLSQGRDVYVYFDNDGRGHAPYDAMRLAERLCPQRCSPQVSNGHPGSWFAGRMA